jgi:tetratricopeptide (TPR) repeat protein
MLRFSLMLALAAGLLLSTTAHAQSRADKKKAQAHYAAGLRAYNVGEFELAIKEWKSAYRLFGAPDFLFNVSQAYRQLKNYERAIFFINAYLREKPDAKNADEVLALRDDMQRLLEEQERQKERPPTNPVPPDHDEQIAAKATGSDGATAVEVAPPATTPSPSGPDLATTSDSTTAIRSGRSRKRTGVIASAVGGALVLTGGLFALSASSTEKELEKAAANGEPWTDDLQDREAAGKRASVLSAVFTVSGIAAIGGGAWLFFSGRSSEQAGQRTARSLQVAPTRDGISARLSWEF